MGVHMDRWALFILSLLPRIRAVSLNFDDIPQERRQEAATNLTNAMSYLNTTRELSMTLHQATARDTLDVFLKAVRLPPSIREVHVPCGVGLSETNLENLSTLLNDNPIRNLSISVQTKICLRPLTEALKTNTSLTYLCVSSGESGRDPLLPGYAVKPFLELLEEDHHTLSHLTRYCVDMADKDTTQRKLDKIKFLTVLNCYNRRAPLFGPDATTKDWFRVIASPRGLRSTICRGIQR
ncbi:expressed unknown protein [Seminavis robusta]|uniref:F-box domain-containing protein n=1 Tax=Seminavis robusta TaxID=568900 RepID=A0A9N8H6W7_9STRA|nr:expressed unknown protein [Seminavis robusta]|eukprot:Sro55_g032120.1 n/a (238) ;mRNA; f:2491-3204